MSMRDQIEAILEEDELGFSYEDDSFLLRFRCKNGNHEVAITPYDEPPRVFVVAYAQVKVPPERRAEVAKFLLLTNPRTIFAKLGLLWESGTFYAEAGTPTGASGELDEGIFRVLLHFTIDVVDEYLPAVMAISFGGATAEEVVRRPDEVPN